MFAVVSSWDLLRVVSLGSMLSDGIQDARDLEDS